MSFYEEVHFYILNDNAFFKLDIFLYSYFICGFGARNLNTTMLFNCSLPSYDAYLYYSVFVSVFSIYLSIFNKLYLDICLINQTWELKCDK